jgi:hypothetical protein
MKAEIVDGRSVGELMTLNYVDHNSHMKNCYLEIGILTRNSLSTLDTETQSRFYSSVWLLNISALIFH